MELKTILHHSNSHPLGAILIKGQKIDRWIMDIQRMGLALSAIKAYAIPNPNEHDNPLDTIWGCLILTAIKQKDMDIGPNSYCQLAHPYLLIPEKAKLFPAIGQEALGDLLKDQLHLLHPALGLIALKTAINWELVLSAPSMEAVTIQKPVAPIFIPKTIKSFQIKPLSPEEVLEHFASSQEAGQKLDDEPLNPFEKARLFFYKKVLDQSNAKDNSSDKAGQGSAGLNEGQNSGLFSTLQNKVNSLTNNFTKDWQEDFEALQKRNQKQLDKLLELLKKDPKEALKYAIPLDKDGTTRGNNRPGKFNLDKRWWDFSLFGNTSRGSGSGSAPLDRTAFQQLQVQYYKTAEELIKQGEYHKAAFVYMKLLGSAHSAASTLEKGGFYAEAAAIYLKYLQNKEKAAECYEKGNMLAEAIALYQELSKHEKVGDLYMRLNEREKAFIHYKKTITAYRSQDRFIKAALIYRYKMSNPEAAQEMLLNGWRVNKDPFNCLDNYFVNIKEDKALDQAIQHIHKQEVRPNQQETFLKVLQKAFNKRQKIRPSIRAIAHEVIAERVPKNRHIVKSLRHFDVEDRLLGKDVVRFIW